MRNVIEKGLIVRKENPFDKIINLIYGEIFKEEDMMEKRLNEFMHHRKVEISKIVIPKEIKKLNS